MITENNIAYHELIGLKAEVAEGSSAGVKGKVVDETMSMLEIESDGNVKKIAKKNSKFIFTLPSRKRVLVTGEVILARPEDRIKKKVKQW